MTTRTTPSAPGTPCWVDVVSSDVEKSKAFYTGLFGWTAEEAGPEFGGYVNFHSDGHPVAGMAPNTPDMNTPDVWTTYISTADIGATAAASASAGGQVIVPPMPVADLGSMAVMVDPSGAVFGAWQPGQHIGFTKYNEPGAVMWDELHTRDFSAAADFYPKVFDWDVKSMSDSDELRYSLVHVNGEQVAGLMDCHNSLPAETPPYWAVYFSVVDVDAAVEQLLKLGGTVTKVRQDTKYGRVAEVNDATGAAFRLHSMKLVAE